VPEDAKTGEALVVGGVSQVLEPLSRGLDIVLDCKACEVHHSRDGATVVTNQDTFMAKHVIIAVPNGVLKNNHISFYPPLAPPIQRSICALDAGLMDVVILRFAKQFWPSDVFVLGVPPLPEAAATANTQHSPHKGLSDVMMTQVKRGGGDGGGAACGEFPSSCLFSSFMNLTMSRTDQCPLLLGQVYGRRAMQLEGMSNQEVASAALQSLRVIFGAEAIAPIGCVFHKWGSDEMAYGSWNSAAVGVNSQDLFDFKLPAECHLSSCLQFAGEWTESMQMGLLQGAYASGERAADHIIRMHRTAFVGRSG
jgi:monoamine oxidase